jgi:phenylacetate-coenzyme A ligase PaaK-like adenylate-forming protein
MLDAQTLAHRHLVPSADFQRKSAEHLAYLIGLMPEFVASLAFGREQIEGRQTAALRRLLDHAIQRSPWHRRRLSGIDPTTATAADLERIPVMTKEELMEHWDEIVTVPSVTLREAEAYLERAEEYRYYHDDHLLITSGGSGGVSGVFLYDWHGWAVNRASISRSLVPLMLPHGLPSTLRTASVSANAPMHYSGLMSKSFSVPTNPTARFPVSLPIRQIVEGLNEYRPDVVHCFSSYLPVLCDEARRGRLRIDPKIIFCTSEPLLDHDFQSARATWPGAAVLSCWSTSETSGTFPCPAGNLFHVSEDINLVEPVDRGDLPIKPGERSAAVHVTNLYNLALPILRYRIEDVFEMLEEPCGCGSRYRAVKKVHGRAYEVFVYGDLAAVHPEVLETPIVKLPKIIEYQMRQTPRGADVDIVAGEPFDEQAVAAEMRALLTELGLPEPVATVRRVSDVPRTLNGKLKRYVALRA